LWFGGRESIFLFSHTNEFCGKSKVAHEAVLAWAPLKVRRRVCERGASQEVKTEWRTPPKGSLGSRRDTTGQLVTSKWSLRTLRNPNLYLIL